MKCISINDLNATEAWPAWVIRLSCFKISMSVSRELGSGGQNTRYTEIQP